LDSAAGRRPGAYHRPVDRLWDHRERPALRRLDQVLGAAAFGLMLLTWALLAIPSLSFALVDRSLDVAIDSLTMLAAASLAALALARHRESGRVAGLFQSSAFLVMALVFGLAVGLVVLKLDGQFGLTLALPEQLPLYAWSISRVMAAALLAIGGLAAISTIRGRPPERQILLLPVVATALLTVFLFAIRQQLPNFDELIPPFLGPEGVLAMIQEPNRPGALPGATTIGLAFQAATVGLFLVGAWFYRQAYLNNGPVFDGYLAVAMLIGAFSELHFYFYPGVYSGLVTTGDALRVAFFLILLLGIYADSSADLRALRSAYAALDRLRQSEADRAALEERARLARELHDGLSQDLWFAKLKHDRLVQQLQPDERGLALEVGQALDAAIGEAKQALVTMRSGLERDQPVHELLAQAVEDFGSRHGLRADFSSADLPLALAPRTQVELLRVLQEALTNVRKHADATVVRVTADVEDGRLVLSVIDNGKGFRPTDTAGNGLGLQGMKERARLMGGQLRVISEPSAGTHVRLSVPIDEPTLA
jgi:signal transduction histidine kinase